MFGLSGSKGLGTSSHFRFFDGSCLLLGAVSLVDEGFVTEGSSYHCSRSTTSSSGVPVPKGVLLPFGLGLGGGETSSSADSDVLLSYSTLNSSILPRLSFRGFRSSAPTATRSAIRRYL